MGPGLDQNMSVQPCSPPMTITQTVTASYGVMKSSLSTILKQITKVKETK